MQAFGAALVTISHGFLFGQGGGGEPGLAFLFGEAPVAPLGIDEFGYEAALDLGLGLGSLPGRRWRGRRTPYGTRRVGPGWWRGSRP